MRVATWNVNGLRARLEFVLAWLEDRKPDVVGFQELKMTDDQFPTELFAEAGYQVQVHGQKAWNGVAILTRSEAELVQAGLPGQEDFGARLITAQVEDMRFTTVYCPNGKNLDHDDYPRKLAWFDALSAHLNESGDPDRPEVICGDFNICPTDLDTWNPEGNVETIFHTQAERTRLSALDAYGMTDLFRKLHPEERAYSWWDYRGGSFHRGHALRIDFIYGTPAIQERVEAVVIDRDWRKKRGELKASDHAPVYADLRT